MNGGVPPTRARSRACVIRAFSPNERRYEATQKEAISNGEIHFSKFCAAGYNCRRDRVGCTRARHSSRSFFAVISTGWLIRIFVIVQ